MEQLFSWDIGDKLSAGIITKNAAQYHNKNHNWKLCFRKNGPDIRKPGGIFFVLEKCMAVTITLPDNKTGFRSASAFCLKSGIGFLADTLYIVLIG